MATDTKVQKPTPPDWNMPTDPRKEKGSMQYPNYYSHKTRSGHTFIMDDSNGKEHVTLQHRGGSTIQFLPDGAIQLVANKGMFTAVFGPKRIKITGSYDIVVEKGGASLRVDGDYNVTVKGNMNLTVTGDLNMTSKNQNNTVRGNMDIQAKNKTEKIEGSSTSQSLTGAMSLISKSGMTIGSTGDAVAIGGKTQVGIVAKGGPLMMESASKTSIKSGAEVAMSGTGLSFDGSNIDLKGSSTVKIGGGSAVHIKSSTNKATPDFVSGADNPSPTAPATASTDLEMKKAETPAQEPVADTATGGSAIA